jgi:peptidoglycan/LPS O-acetylase OafA/YrhL
MKLGTISYFAYLYHIPIIELARRAVTHAALGLTENASDLFAFFLGAVVTLALAAFSWKFFESPLVRWGKSFEY